MNYQVEVRETLIRTIDVTAKSEAEALSIIRDDYKNERFVLDGDDFSHSEMNIL